jgi:hypothetical protein
VVFLARQAARFYRLDERGLDRPVGFIPAHARAGTSSESGDEFEPDSQLENKAPKSEPVDPELDTCDLSRQKDQSS